MYSTQQMLRSDCGRSEKQISSAQDQMFEFCLMLILYTTEENVLLFRNMN